MSDEMKPDYDFSGGERGKYAERYKDAAKLNLPISLPQIIKAARQGAGKRLPTSGQRSWFQVEVVGDRLVFLPPSGKRRTATSVAKLEEIVRIFNASNGSVYLKDYADTKSQNLSYILRLARLAADEALPQSIAS